MNTIRYFLVAGLAVLSLGCPARSIFPLFTSKDFVSVSAIVGTWVNEEGDTITFQKAADNSYDVVSRDKKGSTGVYKAQIGRLGKSWFLDLYSDQTAPDYSMIRTHMITRMSLDGDSLQIALLESDWLKKVIEDGKLKIAHVVRDGDILLTASTEELQELVLRYADNNGAFPPPDKLARMK